MCGNFNKTELKEQVKRVIEYSQDIDNPLVDDLIEKWYIAKKDFIKLFDGNLIYSTPDKITIDLNEQQKQDKVDKFCYMLNRRFSEYSDLIDFITFNSDSFFDNILKDDYDMDGYHIKAGIKMSKAFRSFVHDEDDLYYIQTAASQIIQEAKITGYLCLSVHPLDYLSSSENTYNWRSCHSLDGEYRNGNLSYMLDKSTIVCYICDNEDKQLPHFPPSVPWNSKKWRMLLFVSDNKNALFAGRGYPFFSKTLMEETKERMIKLLSHDKGNSWQRYYFGSEWSYWHDDCIKSHTYKHWDADDGIVFKDKYFPIKDTLYAASELITDITELHFNDLLRSSVYDPYYCWDKRSGATIHFTIGAKVKCLKCGAYLEDDDEAMVCKDCLEGSGMVTCSDCGQLVREDEAIWLDREDRYICPSCYEDNYLTCENCLEIFHRDDIVYDEVRDRYYCTECYEDLNSIIL